MSTEECAPEIIVTGNGSGFGLGGGFIIAPDVPGIEAAAVPNIRFDLASIGEAIVVTAKRKALGFVCPASPVQLTFGADAYLGLGASGSVGGSLNWSTGEFRFVAESASGLGFGSGLGFNVQIGREASGASFASQMTGGYIVTGTVAAPVADYGSLPNSISNYRFSRGSVGVGIRAGFWGNNALSYTSSATPELYDFCEGQ
jgi:hypothetical protein